MGLCLVASTSVSMSLLSGRKEELGSLGLYFSLSLFLAKGLLLVSELWLLPPKLSLQLVH